MDLKQDRKEVDRLNGLANFSGLAQQMAVSSMLSLIDALIWENKRERENADSALKDLLGLAKKSGWVYDAVSNEYKPLV